MSLVVTPPSPSIAQGDDGWAVARLRELGILVERVYRVIEAGVAGEEVWLCQRKNGALCEVCFASDGKVRVEPGW